jgi:hypothetical protein
MLTKTNYGLRSSLDELDTLLDVLLEAESSRNIHEVRAVVGVSGQKLNLKFDLLGQAGLEKLLLFGGQGTNRVDLGDAFRL